jgi:hypothetical protein
MVNISYLFRPVQQIALFASFFCAVIFLFFIDISSESTQKEIPGVAFVLDVSQSMWVQDISWKSRLEAAKWFIRSTLIQYPYQDFSLTIFAGESLRVLPFTSDASLFATFLEGIDHNNVWKQWSRIDMALEDAIANFVDTRSGTIVLLTDGADDDIPVKEQVLSDIQKKDIDIIIVWVGTKQGWYIPTGDVFSPYKLYKWNVVVSKLNETSLKTLATRLGWNYVLAWDDIVLEDLTRSWNQYSLFLFFCSFMFWWIFIGLNIYQYYKKI